MKFETKRKAVEYWVNGFNAHRTDMIKQLNELGEEFEELTNRADYEEKFPKWRWMFQFDEPADDEWIEYHVEDMEDCGFRVYKSEKYGYFFGIDGTGYDFYDNHWVPLYEARGLQWHKEGVV